MTSLDLNKTILKENPVVVTTMITHDHLPNGDLAKDDTIYNSSYIPRDKGKYYYSLINNSSGEKYVNAFIFFFLT